MSANCEELLEVELVGYAKGIEVGKKMKFQVVIEEDVGEGILCTAQISKGVGHKEIRQKKR